MKINEKSLAQAIETLYLRAEDRLIEPSGECHLYGEHENGTIINLFFYDFGGHTSWIQGKEIVQIHSVTWFQWDQHEDLGEWLIGELNCDERESFLSFLREELDEHIAANDIKYHWDQFQKFNEKKWDEYMEKWKKIYFEHHMSSWVDRIIKRLEEDGWYISNEIIEAKITP